MNKLNRVPLDWDGIYKKLLHSYENKFKEELGDPFFEVTGNVVEIREKIGLPTPLILAGWWGSSDSEKIERWNDTIRWANKYGFNNIIDNINDDEYYYF